ncbi:MULTISPECIES: Flp family type IVb pilin [Pseudomonas]|uniref:Pilus assembly protein n=2 Tax=Pseudomonadaceae TaxID=135621 RepID=A0A0D0JLM8_9PSED|nr:MULTISPECIES: Flp family type IVb pilin [Pseudomonas]KIP96248.1 pilus assembly protein [Pseudomonas fulva]MCW2289960.1 pilus assembly protein Flp/PilA [Pseudomonas sp. BIGb0408]NYH75466.1 pilus assembly protein Flp/PilA [Pseudomonas flavescens]
MLKLIILRERVREFFANEDGASAIEYSIIAALIAVVIVSGATALGTDINAVFTSIANTLPGATGTGTGGGAAAGGGG